MLNSVECGKPLHSIEQTVVLIFQLTWCVCWNTPLSLVTIYYQLLPVMFTRILWYHKCIYGHHVRYCQQNKNYRFVIYIYCIKEESSVPRGIVLDSMLIAKGRLLMMGWWYVTCFTATFVLGEEICPTYTSYIYASWIVNCKRMKGPQDDCDSVSYCIIKDMLSIYLAEKREYGPCITYFDNQSAINVMLL